MKAVGKISTGIERPGERNSVGTLKLKMFDHVTKLETIAVGDVQGRVVSLAAREGVAVFKRRPGLAEDNPDQRYGERGGHA